MAVSVQEKGVILVTGANKGIGKEAVKQLSHKYPFATILLGTRSLDNGQKAIDQLRDEKAQGDNVKPLELDVTSKQSITYAAQQVKAAYGRLDVLVCNAGVGGLGGETDETIFAVNLDGVHDTIEAFLPVLTATASIIVVASEVGSWSTGSMPPALQEILGATQSWSRIQELRDDWLAFKRQKKHVHAWPAPSGFVTSAYGISKALLLTWSRSFALQQLQRKVVVVCPGYCATDLTKHAGPRSAAQGGESVIWPILHQEAETGKFYQDGKHLQFLIKQ